MEDQVEVGTLSEETIEKIAVSRTWDYALDYPVEIGKLEPICSVTLSRFKGKQIKQVTKIKDQFEQGLMMIELSANLSQAEVEEMDITDITALIEICSVFMDASHRKRKPTGI